VAVAEAVAEAVAQAVAEAMAQAGAQAGASLRSVSATRLAGAYLLVTAMLSLVFAGALLLGPYRAVERSDYMTYHVAARIVLDGDGSCLYEQDCQAAAQRELIGEEPSFEGGALPFNSPPWFAALVTPLGLLPLAAGFAVFTLLGLVILVAGTWRAAGRIGWGSVAAGVVATGLLLTAWPTVMAVVRGQATLPVVGLLGLSVAGSGVALGASVLKPTLAPAWALALALTGRWRPLATAAVVLALLMILSLLVVSPAAVLDYPAHLVGVAAPGALGVHVEEMVNWRGAAERLDAGTWLVMAGEIATVAAVLAVVARGAELRLVAAAAFVATPLLIPHANQHESVLAALGVLLALTWIAPARRRALVAGAIGTHAVLWAGPVLPAEASAWLLFGAELGWLAVIVVLAWRQRYFRPVSVHPRTD
jgi:hypothetical protein